MRKIGGIAIIIFSLVLAIMCAIYMHEDVIFANIMLWLISVPLYIIGQIIRTSKSEFKHRGKRWVTIYIFFFFILPLLIYINESYNDFKENTFVDKQFIVYESTSGILGELSVGIFVILIFLLAGRFLNPGLKRKKLLNGMIVCTVIFLIGFNYLMFSDYRGIHEEKGLISSDWKGKKEITTFEEIKSVNVIPYVHYASLSDTSDETRFVWKVIFKTNNDKKDIVYYFPMITESNLEQTNRIKKIALENNIKFIVKEMNPKTLKWFEFDLKLEGLDKERYDELFQVNEK